MVVSVATALVTMVGVTVVEATVVAAAVSYHSHVEPPILTTSW